MPLKIGENFLQMCIAYFANDADIAINGTCHLFNKFSGTKQS